MVYSAAGNDIYAWRRGCELKHTYKGHQSKVKLLLPFGPHLISIDEESQLFVFDIKGSYWKEWIESFYFLHFCRISSTLGLFNKYFKGKLLF